jgi:hypothetical protein
LQAKNIVNFCPNSALKVRQRPRAAWQENTRPKSNNNVGLKAWWEKVSQRFKDVQWSKSTTSSKTSTENNHLKVPTTTTTNKAQVSPSHHHDQHIAPLQASLSPFPQKKAHLRGMRGLVSNSAGFRRKVSSLSPDHSLGDLLMSSFRPVYPPFIKSTDAGLHFTAEDRSRSVGDFSEMILSRYRLSYY